MAHEAVGSQGGDDGNPTTSKGSSHTALNGVHADDAIFPVRNHNQSEMVVENIPTMGNLVHNICCNDLKIVHCDLKIVHRRGFVNDRILLLP